MTAVEQIPTAPTTPSPTAPTTSAFASELRLRVDEAAAALAAAEAMEDPLLAQIAEGDLADLRALAARNDVDLT